MLSFIVGHRYVDAGQGAHLLDKVFLVAYLTGELDRRRQQSGKGGLSQVPG